MKFLKRFSLKIKLSLLFSLIFIFMLGSFCFILYAELSKQQFAEFDRILFNYAIDIAESLDIDALGDVEFDKDILKINEKILPFTLKNSFIEVLDIEGNSLRAWPEKKISKTNTINDKMLEVLFKNGVVFSTVSIKNNPHRTIRYLLPLQNRVEPFILQISVPETDFLQINRSLIHFFYLSVPIMLILSLLCGYFFINWALKPMIEIINKTKEIEADDLSQRVPIPDSKDEIWQLADTINLLLVRLDKAFRAQERFVQDASHQLKTPLAIMKGELDIFRSEPRDKVQALDLIESMGQEIDLLSSLTNNLLILARYDAGDLQADFGLHRLDEVVISQLSRLSKMAKQKNITFDLNFDSFLEASEEKLIVSCDRELLSVLFYNLIENAIKYSPDQSTIKIQGEILESKLRITVSDQGYGIDCEDSDKLFKRFFRQKHVANKVSGSGLGLAICKAVSDIHNGMLVIEKKSQATSTGATIYFEISQAAFK